MDTSLRKLEHSAALEKAITVYGQPENCTAACKRIMEVRGLMIPTIDGNTLAVKTNICVLELLFKKLSSPIVCVMFCVCC